MKIYNVKFTINFFYPFLKANAQETLGRTYELCFAPLNYDTDKLWADFTLNICMCIAMVAEITNLILHFKFWVV
jgi:hypothetical protein